MVALKNVDGFTDEIFGLLLKEMQMELGLLVNRNIQRNESRDPYREQGQGIKTDLFAIERYVDEVHRQVEERPTEFMKNLYKPLSKDSI